MTFASRMQHKIYWGPLKAPIEWSLKTVLAPWSYLASVAYHDIYWYPFKGEQMMSDALQSEWGRLFANWEQVQPDELGWPDVGQEGVRLERMGMEVIPQSLQVFKTAFTEAPEVAAQRRHHADAAHNAGFTGRSTLDKALIGAGVAAAVAVPTVLAARSLRKHSGNGDQ